MQDAYPAFVRKDLLTMLQLLLDRCWLLSSHAHRARSRDRIQCLHDDASPVAAQTLLHRCRFSATMADLCKPAAAAAERAPTVARRT
jgi:hypothetical protein